MTPEVRKNYLLSRLLRRATELGAAVTLRKPVDLDAYRAEVDRAIALYPDEPRTAQGFDRYINLVRRSTGDAAGLVPLFEAYAESPSPGVREIVQIGLMMKRAQEFPIDWKFTAADGREVDFAKLRGKVVLIDFWATWCHPCVDEIPNVLAAYKKYHDAGFEVVGISLENAGVPPNASPEVAAARLAASKKKLLDFTARNDMPWPQYFDGTGWKNPYTAKYGIRGIPAMFLLDQEGKVASLDARGKKLESELRRLLKR
ncbi:MAG: TlpA family protein disulfide reductase [Opitutaceae bacterium]|nr:TlpA family protein disulfide reductase [Opitutaceae bacterium]